jgi:ADP-ribose pyrophosphatase
MKKRKLFERTLSTSPIYNGRIISVREDTVLLPDKKTSKREIVTHPGAVAVIALTRKNEIVLIRQFRKPAEEALLEIPAGLFHKGESLKAAAKRELEEETGLAAGRISKVLSAFSSPGYSSEVIYYFLAKDLLRTKQNNDHDEFIDVEIMPVKKAVKLVGDGRVRDNKTIIGIMLANEFMTHGNLRQYRRGFHGLFGSRGV